MGRARLLPSRVADPLTLRREEPDGSENGEGEEGEAPAEPRS